MYHYIQNFNKEFKYLNHLSPKNFEKQILYFKKRFVFFNVKDLFLKKKFNKNQIFLTFDDGLKCHFKYVTKILAKYNLNGIFFVPAFDYKRKIILDVHRIQILLSKFGSSKILNRMQKLEINRYINKKDVRKFEQHFYKNQKNNNNFVKVKKILNFYLDEKKKKFFLSKLFYSFFSRNMEKKIFSKFYLSLNDLKKMKKAGMVIGGHTVTHTLMTKLKKTNIQKEIKKSAKFINSINNKQLSFCYPYGGIASYNRYIISILKKNNFNFSISVDNRDITELDFKKNRFSLPRYNCNKFPFGRPEKNIYN